MKSRKHLRQCYNQCHYPTQKVTHLLPIMRGPGFNPQGYLCEIEILLLALSCYIGDADVIDYCGLVWGGLHPEPSLGRRADNVIITWSHTALQSWFQAHCRSFFRLHNWHSRLLGERPAESLQSHCIHTQFHRSRVHPFASRHEGPGVQSPGGTYVKPGLSC